MFFSRRGILAAGLIAASLVQADRIHADSNADGTVILTVTGDVNNPNRGAYDPAVDKFFGFNDVEFDKGAQFDLAALQSLNMVQINADFPKGGQVYQYEGPLLIDVLKAAGAEGSKVTLQALDGYAIEVSREELEAAGAVLALKRDGSALGIGGFGPTQVVFPRADRSELSDMNDDNWIWSIFHISVN